MYLFNLIPRLYGARVGGYSTGLTPPTRMPPRSESGKGGVLSCPATRKHVNIPPYTACIQVSDIS